MTLITRVTRLFKADFHRVLDHIEEPEALLRHAIREMQESLDEAQNNLEHSLDRERQLTARATELVQSLEEIDTQLDLCIEAKKDDLARGLVRRKLESTALKKQIDSQAATLKQSITLLQESLVQNRLTLEHLRIKADALTSQQAQSMAEYGNSDSFQVSSSCISIDDNDIDVALLREKQSRGAS